MSKDTEYESLGENIFPLQYLSEDERKELGILERKCCKSNKNGKNSCSNCSKNKNCQKQSEENKCSTCSKCNTCCRKK